MASGPHRVVRNPITGEEIHYFKGPKPEENKINYNLNHDQRVNEVLYSSRSQFTNFEKMKNENTKIEVPKKPESELSIMANASSIPLLNFTDLLSEDRAKIKDKTELKLDDLNKTKLADLRNQNPIIAPVLLENSARPKSSYNYAVQNDKLDSPLMAYHNQLKKELEKENQQKTKTQSPLVSQMEAPRVHVPDVVVGPAVRKKESIYNIERVADLEKLWLNNGSATPKTQSDEAAKSLKEKLVIDTVVTDQLSRFILSDPNHDSNPQSSLKTVYTARGNRFTINDNHSRPTSSLSENVLAKKCKFNCRVKTPNGRIALRELFGILFLHDGSLTIYEFRLLCGAYFTGMGSGNVSKKANALPFLSRKVYTHEFGRKKGEKIQIWDLYKGSVLYLPCNLNESSLPNSVKQNDYIELQITDVDELEKENLLASYELQNTKLTPEEINRRIYDIKEKLKNPLSHQELSDLKIVNSVRKFMRKQIEDRSVEVYMGLTASLKTRSLRNEMGQFGYVNQQDFYDALEEYKIQIHTEDLNIVWQVLDLDSIGYLSYYVIIRAYFGEMNINRHNFFRALMHKLDTQKVGYVQVSDVYKYYRAARHPKVRSGDMKEDQMFKKFLSSFDLIPPSKVPDFFELSSSTDTKSPLITYEQFEEYYNGLSVVVDSDEDFINILKNSWNQ